MMKSYKKILSNIYAFMLISLSLLMTVSCNAENETGHYSWEVVSNMLTPRFASAVIIVGDNIYAIGGAGDAGYIWDSEWAKFGELGELKSWHRAPSLNVPRGYVPVAHHNGYLYVVGGANGDHGVNLLDTVERATINPDGSLGRWLTEKNIMTTPRRGGQAVVSEGYLYAIGGYNGTFLQSIERAKINSDGSLDEWAELTPMMFERYIHSSVTSGGNMYSIGGHKNASGGALNDVEYGRVSQDSTSVEWKKAEPLNVARYDAGVVFAEGSIYIAGGYDANAIDSVERSVLGLDGVPDKWQIVSTLPESIYGAMLVYREGKLFLVGGALDKNITNSVRVYSLDNLGEIKEDKK